MRLELESLTSVGSFLIQAKISYIDIIPSNHRFQANFEEFFIFSSKNCCNYCYFDLYSDNAIKLVRDTQKNSVLPRCIPQFLEKRDGVGEIKYAFGLTCVSKIGAEYSK